MAHKAPGKSYRDGISLIELFDKFPNDQAAKEWFKGLFWPAGPHCPRCGSTDVVEISHPAMSHRCRDCRKAGSKRNMFSLKTGSVMEGSMVGYRAWAITIYLATTSLKGVSSMRLHRDLGITQKSAWHLWHRVREAMAQGGLAPFAGPVEVDETYVGGRKTRGLPGRGSVGKAVVAGAKDRTTNLISARVVPNVRKGTLQGFVVDNAEIGSQVYTDDFPSYRDMPWHDHEAVKHSVGEYVRDQAHTNGIESFWSGLKRGFDGVYHKMSPKHLDRYVQEFAGRHNLRELDTLDQMGCVAKGMRGKRLKYEDLTADNGLSSGARGS